MKLNNAQLYTLAKVAEHRRSALEIYSMDADKQRLAWQAESHLAREAGTYVFTQDEWLVDVALMIDAIQPSASIYLLADNINVDALSESADVHDNEARIVLWGNLVAYFGGNGTCLVYATGTTKYVRFGDALDANVWPKAAVGMLAAAQQPATPRPFGTNAKYTLAKARYTPKREYYYVPNVRYDIRPRQESRGGHHASPVAHDRSAHKALLTRVAVEAVEAADLKARGYTLVWTEQLPAEVLARMTRRGKAPTPGTLNAYRWIDKSASRVNAGGEQAQRVRMIR